MRARPILILALAALVVATAGIGNAFAYTWLGCDYSIKPNGWAYWNSNCYGTPTITGGSTLTWQNTFDNERSGYTYDVALQWQRDDGASGSQSYKSLGYRQTWNPDGSVTSESGSGDHNLHVYHQWVSGSVDWVDVYHNYHV